MNQDIKKEWVADLRSGKYKQGRGRLKTVWGNAVTTHCCLGVLCEIYNKEANKRNQVTLRGGVLPKRVTNWAGIESNDGGEVEIDGLLLPLSVHNDGQRIDNFFKVESHSFKTFAQIADAIEAQL